ncbi:MULTISPECIES: asparagine synthase (glutamine-hydrolyzing) [unclassified Pseudomonas]|uniref:asparagine synthase (glutamine-hydrolyzing) n=1 Tax=unclassified Pseudomonas TaxID=196821 RepID=UPI002448DDEF|nr:MULTISPECIES: asparagine synthase (glutamine-hydrolyzing) [unclassified Pseudomonas]MDH0895927.1 asparagine synthase (glutamine-hydrolyzing) [Pseudomonas sp. GD03875]MDH1067166.1 asparagine synthase (glutamine-hydrolyzing) [Pseudomonas sp. GD03985]
MCGLIAVRALGACDGLEQRTRQALASLARRGPDAEGLLMVDQAPATLLGHRRLAILDTSSAAEQPMRCPVSGSVLVFNGAIYNFVELREELRALGCVFVTDGDTEVLLQGWRIWGEGVFSRCNGMWAVVLWDAPSGDLVYCRDRLGVKPLYLHHDGKQATLASEIGAIALMRGGYPAPNAEKIFDFLITSFSEQGTATFFEGVRAVPPGQVCRMSRSGRFSAAPYHHWPEPGSAPPLSPEEVRALVESAVSLRLQADVPVASLLSGGLDSSIITRVALNASQAPRQRLSGAFTYGYSDGEQAEFDESSRATMLMHGGGHADLHHVLRFHPIPSADELMSLVSVQGEPFSTPSALASFRTYRAISSQGYKVVLSGEGADELFGGYIARYHTLATRDAFMAGDWRQVARLLKYRTFSPGLLLNRLVWDLPLPLVGALLRRHRPSVGLINDDLWAAQRHRLEALQDSMQGNLEDRLRQDELDNLLPMALRMADRNSMSAGIELRSPFMDHRLVERAFATPALKRVGEGRSKALLRDAFAGVLPQSLIETPKNTGFGHAEQFLVARLPWRELLDDLPSGLTDYIDVDGLRTGLATGNQHSTLWLALSVALWYRSIYA